MSSTPEGPEKPESTGPSPDASLVELLLGVVRSIGTLLAGKLRLAEQEASRDFGAVLQALALVVAAIVLALSALGLAGAGLAMLIAPWVGSAGIALLLVAGLYLIAGAIVVLVARNLVRRTGGLFSETRADIKRDVEWLKSLS